MNWIESRIRAARDPSVSELDLSAPRFAIEGATSDILGEIPPDVFTLTHLRRLNLSGHGIRSVPPEIGRLVNLEELSLADMPGLITANGLYHLPQLVRLDLRWTELPEIDFGAFGLLEMLNIASAGLTALPKGVDRLAALVELDVAGNGFQRFPSQLAGLATLRRLTVR